MEARSGIWNIDAVVKDVVMAPPLLQAGMAPGLVPLILIPDSNYPILLGEKDLCCFSFLFSLAIKVCNSIGHLNFDFCYLCLFLAMMNINF